MIVVTINGFLEQDDDLETSGFGKILGQYARSFPLEPSLPLRNADNTVNVMAMIVMASLTVGSYAQLPICRNRQYFWGAD